MSPVISPSRTTIAAQPAPVPLKLSTDRKVCTHARWTDSKGWTATGNAYGHDRESCVGRTDFCVSCYAAQAEIWPGVRNLLAHNWTTVRDHLADADTLTALLCEVVADSVRRQTRAGVDRPTFRWQWDGDIPSAAFAAAIRRTAAAFPTVEMWLYTRTFTAVHAFATGSPRKPPPNLAVYLSIDAHNVLPAKRTHARHPWTRLAYCADSWEQCDELAAVMEAKRGPACPELVGLLPLVVPDLENPKLGRGACDVCRHCLPTTGDESRRNVRFSTGKTTPR